MFAALKHFEHILECREFVIKTDHKPLIYAFAQKPEKASPRQLRQLDYISQFSTKITYVKGEENVVADALSRVETIEMPTVLNALTIKEAQQQDEELHGLLRGSTSLKLQPMIIENSKIYCDISTGIVRPYIPNNLRKDVFNLVHGLSHPSGRITVHEIKLKYVWPGIKKDILKWARECLDCQRAKVQRHNRFPPNSIEIPDSRFKHINIDIVHMPNVDGYRYCLTIIDRFTRWPVAVPMQDMTAQTVAEAFYINWISHYGSPENITTDQGRQFESDLFQALTKFIGAKKSRTSPYHPASNGMIERWHRTFKAALMCKPHISWTTLLPSVMLGLRTSYKEDLKASPAEMLYGTTLRVPGEFFVHQDAPADQHEFLKKHREIMRSIRPEPTSHHVKTNLFTIKGMDTCTHVFIRGDHERKPLEPPYTGPFKVLRQTFQSGSER